MKKMVALRSHEFQFEKQTINATDLTFDIHFDSKIILKQNTS